MIQYSCECGKQFEVPDRFAGRSGRCPACGRKLSIPGLYEPETGDDRIEVMLELTPLTEIEAGLFLHSSKIRQTRHVRGRTLITCGLIAALTLGAGFGTLIGWSLKATAAGTILGAAMGGTAFLIVRAYKMVRRGR